MADIHGFGDFNNNNNNNNSNNNQNTMRLAPNPSFLQDYEPSNSGFFGRSPNKPPREENFYDFLKMFLCPTFELLSFTSFLLLSNTVIFIIFLFLDFDSTKPFLKVKGTIMTKYFSLNSVYFHTKPWQVYRWVTASFLHRSFSHIFSNMLMLLIFGSLCEKIIGTLRYIILYLVGGILGSLFCELIKPKSDSVGASICVFAIFGGYFAFCFANWKKLDTIFGPKGRCCMVYVLFFLVLGLTVNQMFQETSENRGQKTKDSYINYYGHVGGFIFGFFFGFCLRKPESDEDSILFSYKIWFTISSCICGIFGIVGFLCFYLLDYYKNLSK